MCRRIQCETCGKPSYAGCGRHIEDVLRSVAHAERCSCPRAKSAASSTQVLREAAPVYANSP
jgi:hypothetical protein